MSDSSYGKNGSTPVVVNPPWEPETPFYNPPAFVPQATAALKSAGLARIESPFASEYLGESEGVDALAEPFASLSEELHDEEFAEALQDLVEEAAGVVEAGFSSEIGDGARDRQAMERAVGDFLAPLAAASEELVERVENEVGTRDLGSLSEGEIDALFESYETERPDLSPAFEGFLKGLARKAKKIGKLAKKLAPLAMPHLLVLRKLKSLVRPLLQRVLRMAIDRLPVAVRPAAHQLAQRFLGKGGKEKSGSARRNTSAAPADAGSAGSAADASSAEPAATEPASADAAGAEEEFDGQLAGFALDSEASETEAVLDEAFEVTRPAPFVALHDLDVARRDFAQRLTQAQEGQDITPEVEQFLPAVLPALRLGIRLVGRPRVVKFLAGLVAKHIQKYVGPGPSKALSTALVDTGLRLLTLESPVETEAGYTLASTVEGTLQRLLESAPDAAFEDEELLEAYAHDALAESAAAHFPDALIRADLHEAASASGAWVMLPAAGARKRYKKYSRVLEVSLTSQMADRVRTFGGIPLRKFLGDRFGAELAQPLRVRVHLYEAIPGTRLGVIAFHEKGVAGLGHARRTAWELLHPLTPEVAAVLLGEPGLGRPVAPGFLSARRTPALGQRFYYVEIPGARLRLARRRASGAVHAPRSSQPRVVLDFIRRQLRVSLFYGEDDAQRISRLFKEGAPLPALLRALKEPQERQLLRALRESPAGIVRIVREEAPSEGLVSSGAATFLRLAGGPLSNLVSAWLLAALRRELQERRDRLAGEFDRAAQADEDGVSVQIVFDAGGLVEKLRGLFKPSGLLDAGRFLLGLERTTIGSFQLAVKAGMAGT